MIEQMRRHYWIIFVAFIVGVVDSTAIVIFYEAGEFLVALHSFALKSFFETGIV
jgi:hypothetical protein